MNSRKINPLGNCDSSSWLLSLDPSDSNDKSFKLKCVADNDVTEDFWLALNDDDEYYLEVGGSYAAQFDIGNNFYNKYPGSSNNLSDYQLKVWDQTENCLGWKREFAGLRYVVVSHTFRGSARSLTHAEMPRACDYFDS